MGILKIQILSWVPLLLQDCTENLGRMDGNFIIPTVEEIRIFLSLIYLITISREVVYQPQTKENHPRKPELDTVIQNPWLFSLKKIFPPVSQILILQKEIIIILQVIDKTRI